MRNVGEVLAVNVLLHSISVMGVELQYARWIFLLFQGKPALWIDKQNVRLWIPFGR